MLFVQQEIDQAKKERVAEMTRLCKSFRCYDRRLNTRQFWICTNDITKDGVHFVGLNKFAEKICIKSPKFDEKLLSKYKSNKYIPDINLKGKILEVVVFECGQKYMYGNICDEYIPLLFDYPNEKNYVQLYKELSVSNPTLSSSYKKFNEKTCWYYYCNLCIMKLFLLFLFSFFPSFHFLQLGTNTLLMFRAFINISQFLKMFIATDKVTAHETQLFFFYCE
ncbi:hypothetical protein RFI_31326 [Reticulomyxa filosa]|uniref:Uncharacterized protein n=1 Tax=Reticulomyxa filosa TaxID=46433 RepID=X6LXH6_RETFI|nr:hypothetical protein RFI_31326 [Reticulomyxa filosa]|eukprot:ETO06071.1 hypothetical protein RFI_31326 [Reticulomyxa filosa]